MNKPWERKIDSNRNHDIRFRFYLFCEDENTEPDYFKLFETENTNIILLRNQKSGCENINNAITFCKQNGLLKNNVIQKEFDVWCIYDRDSNENDYRLEAIKDTDFESAVDLATQKNINVAWSNDVFELWFLLHFIEIDIKDFNYTHRNQVFSKLEEILKSLENKNPILQKLTSNTSFNYKSFMKKAGRVINIWEPILLDKTQIAIDRAKYIHENMDKEESIANHKPCTLVYKLINRLKEKGNGL